jgi:hypothetical protein
MSTICESCGGNGFTTAMVRTQADTPLVRDGRQIGSGVATITCPRCKGAGEIDLAHELWAKIGATHRTWRIAQHEGLAACAERLGIEDRHLNEMEHALSDPAPLLADIPDVLKQYENLPMTHRRAA